MNYYQPEIQLCMRASLSHQAQIPNFIKDIGAISEHESNKNDDATTISNAATAASDDWFADVSFHSTATTKESNNARRNKKTGKCTKRRSSKEVDTALTPKQILIELTC